VATNRAIGKNNQLLWHLGGDLKHFKEITSGHPVIMGEKTYYSIGRPLPKRTNIVLSQNLDLFIEGCIIAHSIDEAIEIASKQDQDEIFIIGGGSIYSQTINKADKLYLTIVNQVYDADTFFPEYGDFKLVSESDPMNENGLEYRFQELVKHEDQHARI